MADGVKHSHLDSFVDERGKRWRPIAWLLLTNEYDVQRVYRFRLPWHKPTVKRVSGEYVAWCREQRRR